MKRVGIARKGGKFELQRTETETLDKEGLERLVGRLQAQIRGYENDIAFLQTKAATAKEELAQVLAALDSEGIE